jgi:hypothetical protein
VWQRLAVAVVVIFRWLGDSEGLRHYFHFVVGNFFWKSSGYVDAPVFGSAFAGCMKLMR